MLDLLISPAYAQAAPAPNPIMSFLPLILLVVVFYFLLIRPQMKRNKEHRNMITALAAGDEIVTGGGVAGRVRQVGENFLSVEIADGVEIKVQKHAVSSVLPKGTLKAS